MIAELVMLGCLIALMITILGDIIRARGLPGIISGSISLLLVLLLILLPAKYPFTLSFPMLHFSIYIDGFSAIFVLNLVIIGIASLIASYKYLDIYSEKNIPYYTLILVFIYSMIGTVLVRNWLAFILLWESMTISSYLLIVHNYSRSNVRNAGTLYIITCHIGAILLIVGISLLYSMLGTLSIGAEIRYMAPLVQIGIILMFLGFAIKAGLAPLHYWLPYAHPAAPSPVSALLSGGMVEIGVYGFYRLLFMTGGHLSGFAYLVGSMAVLSSIIALIAYWPQKDFKKLFAWSTIDNIGWLFLLLAIGCYITLPQSTLGRYVALYVFNHGIAKSAAFLTTGALIYAYRSRNINDFKSLIRFDPILAFLLACSIFAIEGMPPFNLFFSKISVIWVSIRYGIWYIGVLFAIFWCISFIYYIILFNKTCLGSNPPVKRIVKQTPWNIYVPIIALIIIASLSNFIAQYIIGLKGW